MAKPKNKQNFDLRIHADVGKNYARILGKYLPAVQRKIGRKIAHLSVGLITSAQMRILHWQFFGDRSLTDVITFPLEDGVGEIIICPAVAEREARVRGHPAEREVLLYAVHGMLHLCGFDDKTARGFATMHRREDEILTSLGIGPVFRHGPVV